MATSDRSVSRVTGSLARCAAGFAAELGAQGYGEASIYVHLGLAADLGVWLSGQGPDGEQLCPAVAPRGPVRAGHAGNQTPLISALGLAPLTGYLHKP